MDFWNDPLKENLYKIVNRVNVPDYVKKATVEEARPKLPIASYAFNRQFPTNTKANTWLSCAYFQQNKNLFTDPKDRKITEHNLKRAAKEWEIDFEALEREFNNAAKKAENKIKYALEITHKGKKLKLYPLRDKEDIIKAAKHLYENRVKLPYEWRHKIAKAISEEAGQYKDIKLPKGNYILKAAGYGGTPPRKAAHQYFIRAQLLSDNKQVSDMINKAGLEISEEEFDWEKNQKYAKVLAKIDEKYNLDRLYGRGLKMPEEVLFEKTTKEAAKIARSITKLSNDCIITDDQLRSTNLLKIARALGEEFVNNFVSETIFPDLENFKEAAKTLKPKDADTLIRLLPGKESFDEWNFLAE